MKKTIQSNDVAEMQPVEAAPAKVHPLLKSYKFVSTRHVDYHNLTAFEASAMTAVLVLAVFAGATIGVFNPLS